MKRILLQGECLFEKRQHSLYISVCVCKWNIYTYVYILWSNFMLELFMIIQSAYGLENKWSFLVCGFWFYSVMPLEGSIVEVKIAFLNLLNYRFYNL